MRAVSRGVAVLATMALSAVASVPANAGVGTGSGSQPAGGKRTSTVAEVKPGSDDVARTHKVTLITGDVVQVDVHADGRQAATVVSPASGIQRDGYRTYEQDKQAYVIPDAAAPYVASGRLDRNLFNVTELVEQGYDDARRATLPLIATYTAPTQNPSQARARLAQPAPAGARKTRALPSVGAVALAEDKRQAKRFWEALDDDRGTAAARLAPRFAGGVDKIWLDAKVTASLDVSVPQIGAPAAWAAGYDGTGVKVAVLDTGIDAGHPDFAGRIAMARNFSTAPSVADRHGHGTHVAATVAGVGAASAGKRKGVAPGASLLIGKVLGDDGNGESSQIIAGMEWAAANAKIVSMSLGGGPTDGTDPLSQAVNNLSASTGALFVIAAGNAGAYGAETVASPGAADAALTVGAVDRNDALAPFSSRGPRYGDHAVKPEITAPGVGIVAARAEGTFPQNAVDQHHARLSGTSMATPHVAGAAAILAQAHPDWTPAQLKAGLTTTAKTADGQTVYEQGTGRVDVANAVRERLTASTGALSLGFHKGPYADAKPVTRTVTYRNGTDHEVTLDLSVAVTAGGKPAAPGMLAVSPASLTLPAGGSADAGVTLDLTKGDLGLYSGRLLATERGTGGPALTTAVGFHKELLHAVKVTGIGRDGRLAGSGVWSEVSLLNHGTGPSQFSYLGADSTKTFLVPPGVYSLGSFVGTPDPMDRVTVEYTAIARPSITIDRDMAITLDARAGKDITVRTPLPAEPTLRGMSLHRKVGDRSFTSTRIFGYYTTKLSAVPVAPVTEGTFELAPRLVMAAPALRAKAISPDLVLHPYYISSSGRDGKRLDGNHRLPLVFVGPSRPEDYQGRDVRGKVVLIRETAGITVDEQVQNAAAAKAGVAMLVSKDRGWLWQPWQAEPSIPTVAIPYGEAADLVRRLGNGPVKLGLNAIRTSPYRYQLNIPVQGGIPENLALDIKPGDVATVTNDYHAVKPGQWGAVAYAAFRPYDGLTLVIPSLVPFPTRQAHYLLANDTTYKQRVWDPYSDESMLVPNETRVTPGSTQTLDWYRGPLAPGTSGILAPVRRTNDNVALNFGEFVDSAGHVLDRLAGDTAARVYRDGELVFTSPHAAGTAPVGVADPAVYRVELDAKQGRPGWTLSTETYSAWTFHSARGPQDTPVSLPILVMSWDLGLDLANAAPAGAPFTLRFKAGQQPTATPVPVKDAKVWVSYNDGGTWKRVGGLRATGPGAYQADVQHPERADTAGFVSIRVQVTDQQGNRLDQTVIRAYALR